MGFKLCICLNLKFNLIKQQQKKHKNLNKNILTRYINCFNASTIRTIDDLIEFVTFIKFTRIEWIVTNWIYIIT